MKSNCRKVNVDRVFGSLVMIVLFSFQGLSQKIPVQFGKVTAADFTLPASSAVDSSAAAVIVADYGVTTFQGNKTGWVSYVFTRKCRIKILDSRAFDLAKVEVSLYTDGVTTESLEDYAATAYNLEGGVVNATPLGKTELFTDKQDKNWVSKRFAIPAVKVNTIIEYSYKIVSDFDYNIPSWRFQNMQYPVLWSEYEITIPSLNAYVVKRKGTHAFDIDKSDEGAELYIVKRPSSDMSAELQTMRVNANTVKHRWVMKDVPAFGIQEYIYSPANYMDRIDFQLAKRYNGAEMRDVSNSWEKLSDELMRTSSFASFMRGEVDLAWLDNPIASIGINGLSELDAAKKIYDYLSANFTCTNFRDKWVRSDLYSVWKKKEGTVGEINLLLTAMLLRHGMKAAPVVLGTRDIGMSDPGYPSLARLNYVLCKVVVDNKSYLLDAAYPGLEFAVLPAYCYNGHARVISPTDPASFNLSPDSIQEPIKTIINVSAPEKAGDLTTGSCAVYFGKIESAGQRQLIARSGKQVFFDQVAGKDAEWQTVKTWVDSTSRKDMPLVAHIDFSLPGFSTDVVYFSPVLLSEYKKNPFPAATRNYPVEMPYPVNSTYLFSMPVPDGYEVAELPKPSKVNFNGTDGYFEYLIQRSDDNIQLKVTTRLNKAVFDAEDYESLRAFFAYISKKESEQIVFKKSRQ